MTTARTPLTGCRYCGIEPGLHQTQPHPEAGWHRHVTPTPEQLRDRLRGHALAVPPLDKAVRTRASAELLGHAVTSVEIKAVIRVALSAGYLWRCAGCSADHFADVGVCGCGATRPARVR